MSMHLYACVAFIAVSPLSFLFFSFFFFFLRTMLCTRYASCVSSRSKQMFWSDLTWPGLAWPDGLSLVLACCRIYVMWLLLHGAWKLCYYARDAHVSGLWSRVYILDKLWATWKAKDNKQWVAVFLSLWEGKEKKDLLGRASGLYISASHGAGK